ncbi:hypothetical protein A1O3_00872 [Capronia epimyces CBS 606.96]|uniref:Uncharacterized protein n=1 Tax=Capronia epimyces CBS 606.96 TaxID=1182542 RepID=W9YHE9_9EURO|nr:uncharacterized protein A1O3_00872 [Capronia epimyces CBS 606.96]EXJ92322.1 hypothetical protein A1O3_00872 [Capronia epimyces CBS 606.96]
MAQIDRLRSKLGLLDRQKSGSRNHSSNFSSSTSSIIAPPPSESVTSLCGAPIDGYMDINSSEDTNPGVAESWIRAMDKEDILEGERMETQTPSSNTGRPGTLLAVMKPFVDSEIPKHLEICVSPTLGSLPRIGEGFANRRKDAVYRPSRLATGLYMAAVTDTTLDDQLVPRLNQTALVLHTLRAFDQAFDVFLTIFGHLRQSQADSPAQQFQVVVAAINCARSARTRVHREVAREILEEVRHRLALYLGVGVIEHTNIWMYLTHLHCELAPKEAGNLVESLPVSLEAQIAHWTVTASCCRNGLVHEPPNVWDHLSTQTVRQVFDDALAHIRNCERSRDAITDSLRTTLDYVEANSVYLDILLDQHWGACGKDGSHIAQAISCLIFEDHLERVTSTPTLYSTFPLC